MNLTVYHVYSGLQPHFCTTLFLAGLQPHFCTTLIFAGYTYIVPCGNIQQQSVLLCPANFANIPNWAKPWNNNLFHRILYIYKHVYTYCIFISRTNLCNMQWQTRLITFEICLHYNGAPGACIFPIPNNSHSGWMKPTPLISFHSITIWIQSVSVTSIVELKFRATCSHMKYMYVIIA